MSMRDCECERKRWPWRYSISSSIGNKGSNGPCINVPSDRVVCGRRVALIVTHPRPKSPYFDVARTLRAQWYRVTGCPSRPPL